MSDEVEALDPAVVQAGRDDVLTALRQKATPVVTSDHSFEEQEIAEQEKAVPPSPTALQLDEWAIRRGKEVLAESELMQKVFEFQHKGDYRKLKGQQKEAFNQLALQTADFHSAVFEPDPQLAKVCENERLHGFMQRLLETAEFKALHAETMLDDCASEMAAASFAKEWVAFAKVEQQQGIKGDMQNMKAVGNALKNACQGVQDLNDARDALGIGKGDGSNGSLPPGQVAKLLRNLQKSQQLRQIVNLAGRYRRLAQTKQRSKVIHGLDDIVGVVMDGDVARLLPSELAMLADPDLELEAMRRIVERQAMCRDHRGVEKEAKGPIVVCVDESGSMSGDRIYTAKALCLAMAWVARQQNRWCCLVGFAGGAQGWYHVAEPGKQNEQGLMDWLEHFDGGGTIPEVPLKEVPSKWDQPLQCPKGKTDMILITDGLMHVSPEMHNSFIAWKSAEKVKLITMIIGEREGGDLAKVSDSLHLVESLSLESEAVGEVVSV